MVDHINNGESGLSVREKLNEVIDRTNTLNGVENQVETNKNLGQQNSARIDKEIQDRIDGDAELWDHVNDVEDQLENLDVSILDNKIDQEITDRTEGDAALQGQIDQEAADRTEGDSELQDQIDAILAQPGAGMVISDTEPEPDDRVEGLQWLDSTTAEVWIWDGERWLEFPVMGGGMDLPEMTNDWTPNTLALRDDKGNAKFTQVTVKNITFSNNIANNMADTWFLSGGETSDNGIKKNDAEGMRSSLDVYSKAEVQNQIDAIPEPAQPFFTDIGNNTIEYFGDQLWVTAFRDPYVGAKLGSDISCSGSFSAGAGGTFGGNVGIGVSDATDKLHVSAGDSGGTSHSYTDLLVESSTHNAIQLLATSSSEQALWFGDNDNSVAGGISYYHPNDTLTFRAGDSARITIEGSGNTAFYGSVTVDGEIRGKQNVIAYYSDIRLKDIQGPIENPVEKVKAIETFYYTHGDRARELGYEGSEIQVGVSAQSVQAVAPELIHRAPVDDDGEGGSVTGESYMTVDYPRLVPLLIECVKQLSAEIDELKK
jgi:hypothetical protein